MIKLFFLFLFVVSFFTCFSQDTTQKYFFTKEWILDFMIDCPDVIKINENGNYSVFNDCEMDFYSSSGLVETGKWKFNKLESKLIFFDRKFYRNQYQLYGRNSKLVLSVKKISKDKIRIGHMKKNKIWWERFKAFVPIGNENN